MYCSLTLAFLFFFSRYAIHNSGISFSVKKVCKWSRYNFTIYISAYETSDRTVNWLIVLSGLFSKAILCQMLELYQTLPQWTTLGPSLEMLLAGMLMSSFIWIWSFIVYLSLSSLLKNASCALSVLPSKYITESDCCSNNNNKKISVLQAFLLVYFKLYQMK